MTQACFSGYNSFVMGPCFSSCSLHCFVEKYFLKNQRGSQNLWEAPGGTKELALRSEYWGLQGSSGQSVPLLGSAGALRSHPTTARASFLTSSLPEEARSGSGASSGWESGRSESWAQPCQSLGQAALGSVSILVSKRDPSEPSILLSHFAD